MSEASFNLDKALKKGNVQNLNDYFSMKYINPHNNTMFIALTTDEVEIKQEIISIMNADPEVSILFKPGKASFRQLDWIENVLYRNLELLNDNGINVVCFGKTVNGTMLMEVENIDQEKVDTISELLRDIIPIELLVLAEGGKVETVTPAQTAQNRPVLAGVEMEGWDDITLDYRVGSLGLKVSWDDGTKEGILTAAHCTNDTITTVYQDSEGTYKKIGDTVEFITENNDAALVQFDEGSWAEPRVWHLTRDLTVVNTTDYADQDIGKLVTFSGRTTGNGTGYIDLKGSFSHSEYGNMANQVRFDGTVNGGDSGGPVYTLNQNDEVTGYGILHSKTWDQYDDWAWYSTLNMIEFEMGTTLNYTREAWLPEWDYRKIINLEGIPTSTILDYQLPVKVYYSSGTDGYEIDGCLNYTKVYMDSSCETDFSDVTFTWSDRVYACDYWMQEAVPSSYAIFWVNIPRVPVADPTHVCLYYGNPSAAAGGGGDGTFDFFDDFNNGVVDSTKWDDNSQASAVITESGGVLEFDSAPGTTTRCLMETDDYWIGQYLIRIKFRMTNWDANSQTAMMKYLDVPGSDQGGFKLNWGPYQTDNVNLREEENDGTNGVQDTWITTLSDDTWYIIDCELWDDSVYVYFNDTERLSITGIYDYTDSETQHIELQSNAWGSASTHCICEWDYMFITNLYDTHPTVTSIVEESDPN